MKCYPLMVGLLVTSLFIFGCSAEEHTGEAAKARIANWEASQSYKDDSNEYQVVSFDLYISGCSCSKRSNFNLTWDAPLNTDVLIEILEQADQNGLLICDCREGDGSGIEAIVDSIDPVFVDGNPGVQIKLKKEVWLTKGEIASKLHDVFNEHKYELFEEGSGFSI